MARLFVTPREVNFINDLTKELIKDVIGQKIYYYSISESRAILGFRPHDARLVSEGGVGGKVTVVETLGAEKLIHLQVGSNSLSILVPATEKIHSGDQLRFELNKDALHLFNIENEKRIMLFKES